jgi:multiple sugar transport system substrate-binding protein
MHGTSAGTPMHQRLDGLIARFRQEAPQVTVALEFAPSRTVDYWTGLNTWAAGDSMPDLFHMYGGWPAYMLSRGLVRDLAPFLKAEPRDSWTRRLRRPVLEGSTFWGKVVGLPLRIDQAALAVNETLFQQAGVPLPKPAWNDPGWTWDAQLEAARRITRRGGDGRLERGGIAAPSTWSAVLRSALLQYGTDVVDPKLSECLLDRPAAVEAVQALADLRHAHRVAPGAAELQADPTLGQFSQGKLGMAVIWISSIQQFDTEVAGQFGWNLAPFPRKATPGFTAHFNWYPITKDSKAPEAAWAFLRFVTGPAGQESMLRTGGSQPMMDGTDEWVLADLPRLARGVLTQSPAHASWHPSPRVVEWDDVDRSINGQLDRVFAGEATAKEAAPEAKRLADAILKAGTRAPVGAGA